MDVFESNNSFKNKEVGLDRLVHNGGCTQLHNEGTLPDQEDGTEVMTTESKADVQVRDMFL